MTQITVGKSMRTLRRPVRRHDLSSAAAVRRCVKTGWTHAVCVLVVSAAAWSVSSGSSPGEVIWAVNCGGDSHVDEYGIAYMRDPLQRTGVASDFGRSLLIQRVPPPDQILYQTERYHTQSFSYEVPVARDGDYVLVLKFCEVWFTQPNQKVSIAELVHCS